jgi:hypothetical protein
MWNRQPAKLQGGGGLQEVTPALAVLSRLPDDLGSIAKAAADSGYFSKDNTQQFEKAKIEPYRPNGRQHHNPTLEERFAKAPKAPKDPDSVDAMTHRMKTPSLDGVCVTSVNKYSLLRRFGITGDNFGINLLN